MKLGVYETNEKRMYYARNRKRKHELGEIFLLPPSRNMRRRIVLAFPDHSQFH